METSEPSKNQTDAPIDLREFFSRLKESFFSLIISAEVMHNNNSKQYPGLREYAKVAQLYMKITIKMSLQKFELFKYIFWITSGDSGRLFWWHAGFWNLYLPPAAPSSYNLGAIWGRSHSVTMWSRVISLSERQPLKAIVNSNSSRSIWSTFRTPASPSAAKEYNTGLPNWKRIEGSNGWQLAKQDHFSDH